jgi:chemotaxis protein MotB
MQPEKVSRVVGLEASVALDKTDPYNPINRRISIVVLNARTAEAVRSGGIEPVADLRNDGKDTLTDAAARATGTAAAAGQAKP